MLSALSEADRNTDEVDAQGRVNTGALIMAEALHDLHLLRRMVSGIIHAMNEANRKG